MAPKFLTSPFDNKGNLKFFKFGGGANEIIAQDDPDNPDIGYTIHAGGGDDDVTGSSYGDLIYGGTGVDHLVGNLGNDELHGGDEDGSDKAKGKDASLTNTLVGDLEFLNGGNLTGGHDTLIGADGADNTLVGDFRSASNGTFNGGNDRLVSGAGGDDNMTGDSTFGEGGSGTGGIDTFVFGVNNGDLFGDIITDFEVGKDFVELTGFDGQNGVPLLDEFSDLAGMWTTLANAGGQLALDLDGVVDGFGDVITFAGFAPDSEAQLEYSFLFT